MPPLKVCICGSGPTAQVLSVLAASKPETEVKVLCLSEDKAKSWNSQIKDKDMLLTVHESEDRKREIKGKPEVVTTDASVAVPESALVILATPAFNHEAFFKAIVKHMDKKMAIVGLPGLPGFGYQCKSILGELGDQLTILSYQMCPWDCKVVEFGSELEVLKTFKDLSGCMLRGKAIPRKPALMSLQTILGHNPMLSHTKHPIETMFTSYSFLQPAIVYGKWKAWDGKGLDSEPHMFETVDEETAKIIENCCKEYIDVANAITANKPQIDLSDIKDIFNWIMSVYRDDIEDGTDLCKALQTNKGQPGLVHEMTKAKTKYKPDLKCNYISVYVPFGMLVVRGVADILGIEMPSCNAVIDWCQEKLGKKYLVEGKLTGSDVGSTRVPQNYGITTLDDLISGRKSEE